MKILPNGKAQSTRVPFLGFDKPEFLEAHVKGRFCANTLLYIPIGSRTLTKRLHSRRKAGPYKAAIVDHRRITRKDVEDDSVSKEDE